ncbi:MAG: type II secretion system protein GspC [Acidobacteriota bacterium]
MQDLIKRYFWIVGAVTVMVCCVFAAKATSHIVEAKYLGDSDHPPKIAAVAPSPTTPVKQVRSKEGALLASRDIFCSDCTPAVPIVNTDPSAITTTSLPLVLLATNVSQVPEQSYATIINTADQRQGSFSIGDPIPGATGKLKEIHYKYVDFENSGHLERLVLSGANVETPKPVAVAAPPPGDELEAMAQSSIKKIDDTHYEIDKKLVDEVLANPMGAAKGARVVPAVKNGKPDGFKLYAIRPSSVYAMLGLSNGDTLQAINGFELTSADKALEVYTKLREATSLQVQIQRRGKDMTLNYQIR